jgi:hypothetical protein
VLRAYKGPIEFNCPYYLTVDSKKDIRVCDRGNQQILHLNSELELQQVLLTELSGQPLRMCYSRPSGLLYVSYYASSGIDVYSVTRCKL